MAFADVAFKITAGALGLATLVLGADLVQAMTKEAVLGKVGHLTRTACLLLRFAQHAWGVKLTLHRCTQPSTDTQAKESQEPSPRP